MRLFLMKENEPLDFCTDCFPSEIGAEIIYGELNGFDVEHPDYRDNDYWCYECGKDLAGYN